MSDSVRQFLSDRSELELAMTSVPRFAVGASVKVIGGLIAEYYRGVSAIVIEVVPDTGGLSHLNKYRVLLTNREEMFYEFQLASVQDDAAGFRKTAS